ncbi:2OG-Fe(II) oxygenase [Nonomuraea sp. LP-02]|uniref:2OG-Fe(II) oxygenase n=1 Tax=Nonomuraea sp. LP-02 TaxID=3097960 RepID=UPI002E2F4F3C|nr:2OG-Fe(II) oxygenase [Nonomuraea sp. LP-02]MED7928812.1 2OG-Fe(II) oxygenase [Nonomuraea sp. LP-02]
MARERLAELLAASAEPAAYSALRKLPKTDLSVTVDGLGPLRFPLADEQAVQLRELGRRARFGRGEQTLIDPEVRDTWEIPKELVRVQWTEAFTTVLDGMRAELGLPPHCRLMPELHSMLLYETGQFFVPHQDSEKDDAMVATLVVSLPSAHTGGELVIEHQGRTKKYRGLKTAVSLVAFYSDCRHQVLPVKTGNRVTLTYNLLLTGDSQAAAAENPLVSELAAGLLTHFAIPVVLPYTSRRGEPPTRLAYLLDHEYTARGLSWSRLKGSDAARGALLRAAAERAGCEITLALAEIQETWDAYDPDEDEDAWYGHHEDEDPDDYEAPVSADDKQYVLQDLIETSTTLAHWISPETGRLEDISLDLSDAEVASTTPTADITPHSSEYEGYMGNYGNTLDRWYRRAALVIWPRSQGFASRAEASPGWALDELATTARAGKIAEAREAARSLESFWHAAGRYPGQTELIGKALEAARELDDAQVAAMLLRPFALERLVPPHGPAFAALATHYGDIWMDGLLRHWTEGWRPGSYGLAQAPLEWFEDLPQLCAALSAEGNASTAATRRIVELSWTMFAGQVAPALDGPLTSRREAWLTALGAPCSGIIAAAAGLGSTDVLENAHKLARTPGDRAHALAMATLRAAGTRQGGFDELALYCADRIRALLAQPQRAPGDWSIELPTGCACELCEKLGTFLRDPERRALDWPLAKDRRRHVHARIDEGELPVHHETRRQGRPYTLVLTKTEALFERERLARERHQADLAWLTDEWKVST